MIILNVTAGGEVALGKEILRHLGIEPGGRIRAELLPDGRVELGADDADGSWEEVRDVLAGKTNGARLSIEEINDAITAAGAAAAMSGLRGE